MRRVPLVALAAALALTACGGGGGTGTTGTTSTTSTTGTVTTGTGWLDLLGVVPDTPANRASVVMEDLEGIRDTLHIQVPADPTDTDALAGYLLAVTLGPGSGLDRFPALSAGIFNSGGQYSIPDLAGWRDEVGFTVADVDADVIAGSPPDTLSVWVGSIAHDIVADAVTNDPVWGGDLRQVTTSGTSHWCWGDDPTMSNFDRTTGFRPLGRGGCLAVDGNVAYRTISPTVMEDALAVQAGDGASLADYEPFRLAAAALEDAGTYAVALTGDAGPFTASALAEQPSTTLDRWEALGVGGGFADDGEYLVLVLVYPDDVTATAMADTLRQIVTTESSLRLKAPWSEIIDGTPSVAADGRVVTAVLPGTTMSLSWLTILIAPDTLTAWS